jgi:DNA-binding response OmpR family regulator
MRILIADDDRDLADALAEFVRECNHEVADKVTGGGLAVIQSFARHNPDVVLLDIMMPRLNGVTVCHAILSRKPETKIIFVSGKVEGDHPFVAGCGATAYLQKPILLNDLREILDTIAGTKVEQPETPSDDSGAIAVA